MRNGRGFEYASEVLRNDREMVLTAVRRDVLFLEYASEALRNDRAVVLKAVRQYALALL